MAQMNKNRERAESAFGKTQSLSKNRTLSEEDAVIKARNEKTTRLRDLRMAKEAEDLAAGLTKTEPRKSK
jgi:hypothetical protein